MLKYVVLSALTLSGLGSFALAKPASSISETATVSEATSGSDEWQATTGHLRIYALHYLDERFDGSSAESLDQISTILNDTFRTDVPGALSGGFSGSPDLITVRARYTYLVSRPEQLQPFQEWLAANGERELFNHTFRVRPFADEIVTVYLFAPDGPVTALTLDNRRMADAAAFDTFLQEVVKPIFEQRTTDALMAAIMTSFPNRDPENVKKLFVNNRTARIAVRFLNLVLTVGVLQRVPSDG